MKSINRTTCRIGPLRSIGLTAAMILGLAAVLTGQDSSRAASTPSPLTAKDHDETIARIIALEEQLRLLKDQIDVLTNLVRPPRLDVSIQSAKDDNKADPLTKPAAPVVPDSNRAARQNEIGVNLGPARLTPYGTIFVNAFGNSSGTNNADVPLFASLSGGSNVSGSLRQSRLGLRVEGIKAGTARVKGIIEADFFGGFPSVGIGENFGIVRLRLANVRLDWEKTALTLGQDWMVFAPLSPTSLAATAIPQMAAAGNPWARLPQAKIETKIGSKMTLSAAVLAPQTGDSAASAAFFLQPTSGSSSRMPFFQGRIGLNEANWFGTKKPGTIAISGHYGRSRVLTGTSQVIENSIESVGVALDWNLPLSARLTLQGETFAGRNLGGFQSGIFQAYNTDFSHQQESNNASGVRAIGTRGGWTQLSFTPDILGDRFSIFGSIGVDDPRDDDLATRSPRDFRTRNFVLAANAIYKITPQLQIGAEFRRMHTHYTISGRKFANHFNLAAAYSF